MIRIMTRTIVFILAFAFGLNVSFAQEGHLIGTTTYRSPEAGHAMTIPMTSLIYQPAPKMRTFRERDIIYVQVKDSMTYTNTANNQRKRNIKASSALTGFFKFGGLFNLPGKMNANDLPEVAGEIDIKYQNNAGMIRKEKLETNVACEVKTVQPNGNLYIEGTSKLAVGEEVRVVYVSGTVRSDDVSPRNMIQSDMILDLVYEDRTEGNVYDAVRRPWGTRLLEHWAPF